MTQPFARSAVWTYGLAFLGAYLGFMPLLVLLLPRRVEAVAPDETATLLSLLLLTGGVVAGFAHLIAGALSDRWIGRFGSRRGLIAIGAGLLFTAYVGFAFAQTKTTLFVAVVYFQIALNCSFAPLGVLLADHFPDELKGRLSGLGNAALPTTILLVAPIAWVFPEDDPRAFLFVGGAAVACMLPLLIAWNVGAVMAEEGVKPGRAPTDSQDLRRDLVLAWTSRLLVQTGASFAIGYVYLYIAAKGIASESSGAAGASEVLALLTAPAAILAILATLFGGMISDLKGVRRLPTFGFACVFGIGLGLLAIAPQLVWFLIAYGLLQLGLSGFLSVETALVAQLVGGNPRRGFLLGVMNLSNTLPSIIAPSIALLALVEDEIAGALSTLFGGFAIAAIVAGCLILFVRNVR
ncbi:MAG: MFS transporter [Erythrobacter sp.]|uniref:MFS transporter n=1 Tax=Erythrobacter sp. TaxID=1042 RepID=UPI0032676B5A